MEKIIIYGIDPSEFIRRIAEEVANILDERTNQRQANQDDIDILDDFIPKHEVRGKLASSATLWKWEKAGKIKSYGIGGKRFYKRSELTEAITEVKI